MKPAPLTFGRTGKLVNAIACGGVALRLPQLLHDSTETPPKAGAAPGSEEKNPWPEYTKQEWKQARDDFPTGRVGQSWSCHRPS